MKGIYLLLGILGAAAAGAVAWVVYRAGRSAAGQPSTVMVPSPTAGPSVVTLGPDLARAPITVATIAGGDRQLGAVLSGVGDRTIAGAAGSVSGIYRPQGGTASSSQGGVGLARMVGR